MAYYSIPGYIAFIDPLPPTATQKIQPSEGKRNCTGLLMDGSANELRHKKRIYRDGTP